MIEYEPPDNYTPTIDDICGKYDDEIFKLKEQINSDAINLAWYQTHLESKQATVEQQAKEIESLKSKALESEKWQGIALAKFGDGRTVQQIKEPLLREIESMKAELETTKGRVQRQEDAVFDCRTRHEFALQRIDALEAELGTLKSQTSEPVVWMQSDHLQKFTTHIWGTDSMLARCSSYKLMSDYVPLYLAAPAQKEGYVNNKRIPTIQSWKHNGNGLTDVTFTTQDFDEFLNPIKKEYR